MFGKIKTALLVLFLVLISAWSGSPPVALVQSETPYDLIDAVNTLRASQGLEPYRVDPWLMAYAQEHSEYQATMQSGTHLHSDSTLPQSIGLQENVAGGDNGVVTVTVVVYEIWVDWGHRHVLTGYAAGDIGAGMAFSDNGQVYYTADIRPGDESTAATSAPATAPPFIPLITSTPDENGSMLHIVRERQTLWSIAQSYGVTVEEICRLNGMPAGSTFIYVGQKLFIRPASTAAPTLSGKTSSAPAQPLNIAASPFTKTAAATGTAVPSSSFTLESTNMPQDMPQNNKGIGLVIALTGAVGVLIVAIFGFRKSRP